MDIQSQSRFLLVQRLTMLVNRYDYFLYTDGLQGVPVAHAEQKRFSFREEMTVWSDESRGQILFTVKAEKVLDVHGKFLVRDAEGVVVGYCKKAFGSSLLRSTWEVYDAADQLLFTAREQNATVAIVRRVLQFVPMVGEFAPFIPINFVFEKDGATLGTHRRVWGNFKDTYELSVGDALAGCDRRLLLALGILLDALQDR